MTATLHLAAVVGLLIGTGLLPARALAGGGPAAVAVAPLVTGLLCAAGATVSLVVRAPLLPCVGLAVAAAWAASMVLLRRRPPPAAASPPTWAQFAALAALLAVLLVAVRRAPVGWDARMIWFFHADWLAAGGERAAAAMADPAFEFSHPDYPPLAPAAVAAVWKLLGRDLEVAQLVVAVLGASATLALSLSVVRVAERLPRRAAVAAGTAVVLAAYGIAGVYATNGYVDLQWAAAFTAGAVCLLLGPPDRPTTAVGLVCLAAAMVTKNEGMAAGLAVLALVAVARGWRRALPLAAAPVGLAAAWVVVARAAGAEGDVASGSRLADLLRLDAAMVDRVQPTVAALWSACRWELLVAGGLTAAGLAAGRAGWRGAIGRGAGWIWAAVVATLATVALAYVIGPHEIRWYLHTSVDRTTIAPRLLLLVECLLWVLVLAAERARWADRRRPGPAEVAPDPVPARL